MIWAARILLIGILALATVSLLGAAIAFAAPYIAAILVLWGIGKYLLYRLEQGQAPED